MTYISISSLNSPFTPHWCFDSLGQVTILMGNSCSSCSSADNSNLHEHLANMLRCWKPRQASSLMWHLSHLSSLRGHTRVSPVKLLSPPNWVWWPRPSLVLFTEKALHRFSNVKTPLSPSVSPPTPTHPDTHLCLTPTLHSYLPFSAQALTSVKMKHLTWTPWLMSNSFPLFQPWMLILFVQFYDWIIEKQKGRKRQMENFCLLPVRCRMLH